MIPITIELDKVRHIRYPWKAMVDAEKAAKKGLPFILMNPGVESTVILLWAGLKTDDPTLTIDQTGTILQDCLEKGMPFSEIETAIHDGLKNGGWLKECPELKEGG